MTKIGLSFQLYQITPYYVKMTEEWVITAAHIVIEPHLLCDTND